MYRNLRILGLLALATTMLTGCFSHDEDILVGEQLSSSATKIINSSSSAEAGTLLVKFTDEGVLVVEQSKGNEATRTSIEKLNEAISQIGATSMERVYALIPKHEAKARKAGLHRWYSIRFDSEERLEQAAKLLAEVEEVEYVQYNTIIDRKPSQFIEADAPALTRMTVNDVNDPYFPMQWHYYNTGEGVHANQVAGIDVNVKEAWRHTTGDSSIVVAIIDEGVDYNHPDLKANMWVNKGEIANNGIDDDNNGFIDDVHGHNHCTGSVVIGDFHGTHVAGTVSAVNNNNIGVCGIAGGDGSGNGVRIMSSQMFYNETKGTSEISARAFRYAADNGAIIAQCSWGFPGGYMTNDKQFRESVGVEYDGIRYFQQYAKSDVLDGGLVIFAAGNDSLNMAAYPGAYRDLVSVSALRCDGMPAWYTNFDAGVNIAAPGGDMKYNGETGGILSTAPNGKYAFSQGTSMACPHVSGVAALGLAHAKKLGKKFTLEEFTAMLLLSVEDIDSHMATHTTFSKFVGKLGTGRIDAMRMLMNVEGINCISVTKGHLNQIPMSQYFAHGGINPTLYEEVIISDEDKERLGITNGPKIFKDKLLVTCSKTGSAIIEVKCILGGAVAGSDKEIGGRVTTKKFALIVRDGFAENGGWM